MKTQLQQLTYPVMERRASTHSSAAKKGGSVAAYLLQVLPAHLSDAICDMC